MTRLTVYAENGDSIGQYDDHAAIAALLGEAGIRLERWQAGAPLGADADQEQVLAAYRQQVNGLVDEYGFQSVDVVALTPDHPQRHEMRDKFLNEHVHEDFEARFFVVGGGLFYLHLDDRIYGLECTRGDFICVPAGVRHWFDMGPRPDFKCIRLFTTPEGWVAKFTGARIGAQFPAYGEAL